MISSIAYSIYMKIKQLRLVKYVFRYNGQAGRRSEHKQSGIRNGISLHIILMSSATLTSPSFLILLWPSSACVTLWGDTDLIRLTLSDVAITSAISVSIDSRFFRDGALNSRPFFFSYCSYLRQWTREGCCFYSKQELYLVMIYFRFFFFFWWITFFFGLWT